MAERGVLLRCSHVRVRHGEHLALRDVQLELAEGERLALLGLNGSGKTSLLQAIAGLCAHEGSIECTGERLRGRGSSGYRSRLGYVFDVPEQQLLFARVLDDVAFTLRVRGQTDEAARSAATQLLRRLGLGAVMERGVHALSHGQKQRVALAGALVHAPRLLLLDEPTAGLDPVGKQELLGLLLEQEAALVVASHDLDWVERCCTRFVLLEDGVITEDSASLEGIRQRWGL